MKFLLVRTIGSRHAIKGSVCLAIGLSPLTYSYRHNFNDLGPFLNAMLSILIKLPAVPMDISQSPCPIILHRQTLCRPRARQRKVSRRTRSLICDLICLFIQGFLSILQDSLGGHSPEQRSAPLLYTLQLLLYVHYRQFYIQECVYEENQRWPNERTREIVKRYQATLGIGHISGNFDKHYLQYLRKGYFEPIPLAWATSNINPLTQEVPGSQYEDGAGM